MDGNCTNLNQQTECNSFLVVTFNVAFYHVLHTQKVPFGVRGRGTKAGAPNANVPLDQFLYLKATLKSNRKNRQQKDDEPIEQLSLSWFTISKNSMFPWMSVKK